MGGHVDHNQGSDGVEGRPDFMGLPRRIPWDRANLGSRQETDLFDTAAISGLTAGEMLWHAVSLDPDVIAAADFSRVGDLGGPLKFALHAQEFALHGADYALRGYVGERFVIDRLIADGHHLALAPLSNTPGLDLIVDVCRCR